MKLNNTHQKLYYTLLLKVFRGFHQFRNYLKITIRSQIFCNSCEGWIFAYNLVARNPI
jgi:hypothetical protein